MFAKLLIYCAQFPLIGLYISYIPLMMVCDMLWKGYCVALFLTEPGSRLLYPYGLAVLARHHSIPFYVAMPMSTLDPSCPDGTGIAIEHRPPDELRSIRGVNIAPDDANVWNPAFDVTPAELISAWITERGHWTPTRL